eukprot:7079170-Alexandrium_andersonii.AAC.1
MSTREKMLSQLPEYPGQPALEDGSSAEEASGGEVAAEVEVAQVESSQEAAPEAPAGYSKRARAHTHMQTCTHAYVQARTHAGMHARTRACA